MDDDGDAMNVSPATSPAPAARQLARPNKRVRADVITTGRPLALPRLLETLDSDQLRSVLQKICEQHPSIGQEVVNQAPRPSVSAVHTVLRDYEAMVKAAIPYGETSPEYAYQRVRQPLLALTEALADFTPQFLPPHESQPTISLEYLDGATDVIHRLPDWDVLSCRRHKQDAYDDISKAWALVLAEAAKRGGAINLAGSGWDHKLTKHNQQSGGCLSAAVEAMVAAVGWLNGAAASSTAPSSDQSSRFDQLLLGSFHPPVTVGQ